MSIDRVRIRARAKVASSGVALGDDQWNDLCDDAISTLWRMIVRINVDFRVATTTFAITNPTANTFDLTTLPTWSALRSLCKDYGLPGEQYLSKVGPRTGSLGWERGYRFDGTNLVIEPHERSVGNYTLKYTPQPPLLVAETGAGGTLDVELVQFLEFIVRHMAVAAMVSEETTATDQKALFDVAAADVVTWASGQRSADPDTVEDVRGRRRGSCW